MAIYKSSFNPKKPEKDEKPPKEKKVKPEKVKNPKKIIVKTSVIWACVFLGLFVACCFPSNFIKNVLLGMFGLAIYPVTFVGMFISTMLSTNKKFNVNKKYITYIAFAVLIVWFIFHLILTSKLSTTNFWIYLKESYIAKTTGGGVVFSLISYPLIKLLTVVGAYIFSAIGLAVFVGLIIDCVAVQRHLVKQEKKTKFNFENLEEFAFDEKPIETISQEEHDKAMAKRKLGLEKGETTIISSTLPNYDIDKRQPQKPMSKLDYILTPLDPVIPPEKVNDNFFSKKSNVSEQPIRRPQKSNMEFATTENKIEEIKPVQPAEDVVEKQYHQPEPQPVEDEYEELILDEEDDLSDYETAFETDANVEEDFEDTEEFENLQDLNEDYEEVEEDFEEYEDEEIVADVEDEEFVDEYAVKLDNSNLGSTVETEVVRPSIDISKFNLPNTIKKPVGEVEEVKEEVKQRLEIPDYVAPPVELLNYIESKARISDEELQDNIERLEQVLEDFKVPAKVNNVQVGPAVTRYELTMPRGISVNKIAQMADDIAMTLASNGAIRVEAPIPGKTSVGIEVPNAQVSPVSLRELIDSEDFRVRGNPLSFVLGKDINGDIIFCNLDKMPHMLVAGSTGSGKSVCLNTMLLSMCYKAGPQDLRLILVDPKMVEFSTYNGLPHLLIPEVIIGKEMTINALDWSIKEMERRYALFAKNHVVNINEFNKLEIVKNKKEEKLPFIVIVVDELADLMLEAKREIEDRIAKLAAKARAAGIHLVLATQRPSVDVITGTVKANLPSRIAFALTNYMDSKTVLDGGGAEKLLGKGDMLFKPQDKPEPRRIQGAYVSNPEIAAVVEYIKQHNNPVYDDAAGRAIKNPHQNTQAANVGGNTREMEFDPVLKEALRMFIQTKQASASMITRRYSVGFNRAGRIMDQMEMAGFVGPQDGAKPRQVLITMEEYNAIFGDDEN